jgi:hypothetical protein
MSESGRLRGAVIALLVCAIADSPAMIAQSVMSGKEANAIDWETVKPFSPIPGAMPADSSDDPLQAGFAVEWIERSLGSQKDSGSIPPGLKLTLAIASQRRTPDDRWAYEMEQKLRDIIRTKFQSRRTPIARVFCNAVGCLCYLQGEDVAQFDISEELIGQTGHQFGIHRSDLNTVGIIRTPGPQDKKWWLTIVKRPNARAQGQRSPHNSAA